MASLKLTLDKRRAKQDGTFPLVFRISCNGDSRDIPSGFHAKENQWSPKTETLLKSFPAYQETTARIKELEAEYLSKIIEYERRQSGSIATPQELKDYILSGAQDKTTVIDFWQKEIDLMQKAGRNGGARVYMETLVALNKVRSLKIPFEKVDYNFLKEVEADLLSKGVKLNSVGIYYRTLRAVYNKAINAQLASYNSYPFRRYRIRKEPTKPRPLSQEELSKFFKIELKPDSWLYESWLLGKLMFMLIGINFKDMILMREDQIQQGRLIYSRSKTKRQYSIQLLPAAIEILDYFKGRCSETLIGRITPEQLKDKVRLPLIIRQANKVFNKHLGVIGRMVNTSEPVTGYVFRYSHANVAKQLGYSKDLISEALGHSYGLRVTGSYLEAFDLEHIDAMNAHVCSTVMH